MSSRLALGTVQFGLPYGISNRGGQVPRDEAARVLALARANGLEILDTAMAYGDSESVLGDVGIDGWRVITKLPPMPALCTDVAAWVEDLVRSSLQRLKVSRVYGLLLHRSRDLTEERGESLYNAMARLRERGVVRKIGISIYDPAELDAVPAHRALDLVQAPFNVIDRRLESSGWLGRLNEAGIEIHARSAFLQGLLLMEPSQRPPRFDRWRALWAEWDRWLTENRVSPLQACVRFALSRPQIDCVVFGVERCEQLQGILDAARVKVADVLASIASDDPDLINPSRWNES